MKKLKLACLSTLLVSGIASASPSCEGFQIKLKNNLPEHLLITDIKLNGAEINPRSIEQLKSNMSQVFTINNSSENVPMKGEFTLHTLSLPSATVVIQYTLDNKIAHCSHNDLSPESDLPIEKTRKIGEVEYAINK